MTWEPLTRIFCAESQQGPTVFAHTYDAPDTETARRIAEANGWQFLGEIHEAVDESEAEVALFERDINGHTIQ